MDPPETIGTEPPNSNSGREFLTQTQSMGIAAAALPWRWHTGGLSQPLPRLKSRISPWRPPRLPRRQRLPPSGSGASPDFHLFQSTQQYGLSLGTGLPVHVFGFYGGKPVAQFLTDPAAVDGSLPKKPSRIQYRDIVFHYLPVKGAAINTWLLDSLAGKVPPTGGDIHILGGPSGGGGNVLPNSYSGHMSFAGPFVKQIAFPEADRAAQMPAPLRITLAIQQADWHPGASWNITPLHVDLLKGPLKHLFTLSIQNLSLNDVMRIETMVLSMNRIPASQGGGYQGAAPRELFTLRIQLPESKSADLYAWYNDVVVKMIPGLEQERMGFIQWMNPQNPSKAERPCQVICVTDSVVMRSALDLQAIRQTDSRRASTPESGSSISRQAVACRDRAL